MQVLRQMTAVLVHPVAGLEVARSASTWNAGFFSRRRRACSSMSASAATSMKLWRKTQVAAASNRSLMKIVDQLGDDDIVTAVQSLWPSRDRGHGDQKCGAAVLAQSIDLTDQHVDVQAQRPRVVSRRPDGPMPTSPPETGR